MYKYQCGFGNHFATEAIANALPIGQNSPQKANLGLYAEQLSNTAFTMPRHQNIRSWLYRIHPSVKMNKFTTQVKNTKWQTAPLTNLTPPNAMRWDRLEKISASCDFLDGLVTFAANGDVTDLSGAAVHLYQANISMERFFYNADGEMLIVPESGRLLLKTELGHIELAPLEIAVIPRGIKFQVLLLDSYAYGYVCENYGASFQLPELGPIGSNGLANARDFLTPVASFEDISGDFTLVCKFEGILWATQINHSPLDVVAWHGNCAPYKYDLRKFNTIGSTSYDHPDPSIFTVLTSPTAIHGLANIDFVIFPPRWMVAENTFRPPWYHRNIMSEFMGLIEGQYDAKPNGFVKGGASLHNRMVPHGPDGEACLKAMNEQLEPKHYAGTMAFMFESSKTWRVTEFALNDKSYQQDYSECWSNIPKLWKE